MASNKNKNQQTPPQGGNTEGGENTQENPPIAPETQQGNTQEPSADPPKAPDVPIAPEPPKPPLDEDIVEIKTLVNVWDHNGIKTNKGELARLQRKQADDLIANNKGVRIDPIPAIEGE